MNKYTWALKDARTEILGMARRKEQGWILGPDDETMVERIEKMVAKTKAFDTLLVLGIGGSDLGARAILEALPHKKQVLFAGANTDPQELAATLGQINWKKTVVNIISKSGDTLEPMSAFLIVRDLLKKNTGTKWASQIIATTDKEEGTLAEWSRLEGYHTLLVPRNTGGRFSVLSDVGLFPAAWAGISIKELLAGARMQTRLFERQTIREQLPAVFAALHAEGYRNHRSLWVLMPYAAELSSFARWYRQLIAESLGKMQNRGGLAISMGPTPIAGLGATDQHSQIQLYMEGPSDKLITFLEVEKFDQDFVIPKLPAPTAALYGLPGRKLSDVIHAERKATAEALAFEKRPNGTLFIPSLSPRVLGELFQCFMLATACLGELLDVNAFDQPGVQEAKRRITYWLRTDT